MNKKKKALSLGLAAAQLAALAPLYSQVAFAAEETATVSGVEKISGIDATNNGPVNQNAPYADYI